MKLVGSYGGVFLIPYATNKSCSLYGKVYVVVGNVETTVLHSTSF